MDALDLMSLRAAYQGGLTPSILAERLSALDAPEGVWISRPGDLVTAARDLERRFGGNKPPLYGVPFAVKDNIDVAGVPTTAACPALSYTPAVSAAVVDKLLAAGALFVGKTNMDQLATGLVGVRSPYGIPRNPFDARYIVGGSSAGSAAAVARGLCSFALGTDTAGSGRVPAAFNNIVGIKPSRGLLSTAGVVPACRSLDCVSVFALSCEEAALVADLCRGHDPRDPGSRPEADSVCFSASAPERLRVGVAAELFGDGEAERLYHEALAALGGQQVSIPLSLFREAAGLLYDGPWVAERLAPFEELLARDPGAVLPVIGEILGGGRRYSGTDVFRGVHRLEAIRQEVRGILRGVDVLCLPTTPTIYTVDEVLAEPIKLNAHLGIYTNFVNLLDLAAVAVPAGFRRDGLPGGVTLIGPRDSDGRLAAIGARLHRRTSRTAGATGLPLPAPVPLGDSRETLRLAVVGAHLTGEPLNHQLTDLGARLLRTCRTAPRYRLFALPGTTPPKPGLVRTDDGHAIEIEIWELPRASFGTFLPHVRPPLCIGTLETDDGEAVFGFLCEPHALTGARDISSQGSWRRFLHGG